MCLTFVTVLFFLHLGNKAIDGLPTDEVTDEGELIEVSVFSSRS